MKGSSRRSSVTKRVKLTIIFAVFGAALFYLVPRLLFGVAALVMLPIVAVQSWFYESSASLPQFLRDRSALVAEMQQLEQQVLEHSGDQHSLTLLKEENAELRSLLAEDGSERILAGVIARPNQLPYDVLMLDQGRVDGIVEGAPVYIGNQTVIGYVQSTTRHTALVTLVTTPGFSSTVFVFGPDIYTTAVGMGGGQLRIGVPQGIELNEGDLVIVPAVTSGVYGAVTHVESSPTQPEQFGFVSPELPLQGIRLVAVGNTALTGSSFETAQANVTAANTDLFSVPVPDDVLVTVGTSTATSTGSTSTTTATTTTDL